MAQLIVALDVPRADEAERLIDQLYELDLIYKVGMESLYGYGERIFSYMEARDVRHFIDAKLHDIPRTVAAAVTQLIHPNTHIINIHALGGREMMAAAVQAARERSEQLGASRPNVLAVTILTSMSGTDLAEVGLSGDAQTNVLTLARLAREAGCDGVVCSAAEVPAIKNELGSGFLTLTPGIRAHGAGRDDQKRVTSPTEAIRAGADYLVVGRAVVQAPNPYAAACAVLDEMRICT